MKQAIETLISYFDPDTIVQDYNLRDGLTVTAEDSKSFILPDTRHLLIFNYRHCRVYIRIADSGLTVSKYQDDDCSFSNNGLRSECTGWLFYDSTRNQSGDIDLDRILNDVSYRCHFVDYVMSHVNAMLQGG